MMTSVWRAHLLLLFRQVLPYFIFTAVMFFVTSQFEAHEGLAGLSSHWVAELPLLLYLYFLFRQLLKPGWERAVLAAVPIVIPYVLLDVYFLLFGRVFRVSEIEEVPELLQVLPWTVSVPILAVVLLPIGWFLLRIRISSWRWVVVAVVPGVLLLGCLIFKPGLYLQGFKSVANGIVEWSDAESVRWNGRFSMVLYQEAKRRAALQRVVEFEDTPDYEARFEQLASGLKAQANPRNIHFIVLEGFVDPLRFEQLKLSRDPLHPEFRALLDKGMGNLSISPVYGGYTAQAEFEALCAVPALQELGTIEFNMFTGSRTHCMPDVLRAVGYQTIATQGFKPNFFNAGPALKGIGFDEIYFAREYAPQRKTYLSTGDVRKEQYMFDKVLFDQNLDFVRQQLNDDDARPLLNYVLTIYGHFPFKLDEALRPRLIRADTSPLADESLMVVVNQSYYRSVAMANYIKSLIALDPEGIIVLLSDHLPPMPEGISRYEKLGYLPGVPESAKHTFFAVFDHGKRLSLPTQHHYELPSLLYRLLAGDGFCERRGCETPPEAQRHRHYLELMAHAVKD